MSRPMIDFEVLDYGYVRLIEFMGSDERIIEAARMSTGRGFEGWEPVTHAVQCTARTEPRCECGAHPGDLKLLQRLWKLQHTSPFESAAATLEIKAPIMVFREWHRHRTQSYNEVSARYTPLPSEDYVPLDSRLLVNSSGTNRQANRLDGTPELTPEGARQWSHDLRGLYQHAELVYQRGLQNGVPKELARLALTVGRYSRMRATANLLNWCKFLKLRLDPAAQWEIRQFAVGVYMQLEQCFPRVMELFAADYPQLVDKSWNPVIPPKTPSTIPPPASST